MFKVIKDNKIVGVSENKPVLLDKYEVQEDTEHTAQDYIHCDGQFVLTTSDEAIEKHKSEVRAVRNRYLEQTDKYLSVSDFPITDEERQQYRLYRQYLRDYTETEGWYESNPLTFDVWQAEQVKEETVPEEESEIEAETEQP